MQGLSTQEIAATIKESNEAKHTPIEMRRLSRTVVRLFYKTKADRDGVIATGLNSGNRRLNVEYPRVERRETSITIKGLPINEEGSRVYIWLQSVGAQPTSPIRRSTYKGTDIKTNGRQVRVATRPDFVIPPFVEYRSPTCPTIAVKLWHPDLKLVCFLKCLRAGHMEVDCKEAPTAPMKKKRKPRKRRKIDTLIHKDQCKSYWIGVEKGVPSTIMELIHKDDTKLHDSCSYRYGTLQDWVEQYDSMEKLRC